MEIADLAMAAPARLSRRQAELLELLAEGLSNKEIGQRMELSPATVKTMLERRYRRAGVAGRVGLLRWARSSPGGTLPGDMMRGLATLGETAG